MPAVDGRRRRRIRRRGDHPAVVRPPLSSSNFLPLLLVRREHQCLHAGAGPCAQTSTLGAAKNRAVRASSVGPRVGSALLASDGYSYLFFVGRLVSRRDLFMNAWTPHAHGLLGAVVVVVATLFQGVGVEAPRAAALRRRAAEAPLVVARQALAGAERAAGASHHVERLLVAAQRRRRLATSAAH